MGISEILTVSDERLVKGTSETKLLEANKSINRYKSILLSEHNYNI